MNWGHVSGLERIDAVYLPPLRAAASVGPGEWWVVFDGWVLLIHSAVFVVDGVLRLDGAIRIGRD